MPMEPPPSRYKVIEKDGRLITIDTLAGAKPAGAKPSDPAAEPDAAAAFRQLSNFIPRGSTKPNSGLLLAFASAFTEMDNSVDGSRRLRTHRFYDPGAPRLLRISEKQTIALGGLALTGFVLLLILVVLITVGQFVATLFIAAVLFQAGSPILKKALGAIIASAAEIAE
jgi:hypothetical protein